MCLVCLKELAKDFVAFFFKMESFRVKIRFPVSLEKFGRCNTDNWMEMVRGTPFRQKMVSVSQFAPVHLSLISSTQPALLIFVP